MTDTTKQWPCVGCGGEGPECDCPDNIEQSYAVLARLNATRNAAAFRRIAAHLNATGRQDASGNTARTFEACAKRCDRIASE